MADQSEADRQWFNSTVDVIVPPDERAWLDALLEMSQIELVNYATYQYMVPRAAAEASTRNEVIQLIATSKAAGEKSMGSIVRPSYRYLNQLKGLIPPAVKARRGRHLVLTRGSGENMQVYNKETDEWINYQTLVPKEAQRPNIPTGIAREAADAKVDPRRESIVEAETGKPSVVYVGGEVPLAGAIVPTTSPPVDLSAMSAVLPTLPKLNRQQLEEMAGKLGAPDTSAEKFPTNKDLISFI